MTPIADRDRVLETALTRHRDYILTDYPPRAPFVGRLHPMSWVLHRLRVDGWPDAGRALVEHLRAEVGPEETVWGYKLGPGGVALELYYYNSVRNSDENRVRATRITEVLRPFATVAGAVDERLPYFLCSLEVTPQGLHDRAFAPWRVYLGTGDQTRTAAGFSYRSDAIGDLVLENHYWFYRAADPLQLEDAVHRVRASPRSGARTAHAVLLAKELRDCNTICYATKPRADGLYFSRLSGEQVAAWLRRPIFEGDLAARAATETAQLLLGEADAFAHARWDLGFDFAEDPGAERVRIRKWALHGVL